MKRFFLHILPLAFLLFSACTSAEKEKGKETSEPTVQPAEAEPQMQPSTTEGTISLSGKEYTYRIHREPAHDFPTVELEDGTSYYDNRILLSIRTAQGTEVYRHEFRKTDFTSVVNPRFMAHGILEGLVFDRVEDKRMLFAASISYPQSDLYVPARVYIRLGSTGGQLSIEREDAMNDAMPLQETE